MPGAAVGAPTRTLLLQAQRQVRRVTQAASSATSLAHQRGKRGLRRRPPRVSRRRRRKALRPSLRKARPTAAAALLPLAWVRFLTRRSARRGLRASEVEAAPGHLCILLGRPVGPRSRSAAVRVAIWTSRGCLRASRLAAGPAAALSLPGVPATATARRWTAARRGPLRAPRGREEAPRRVRRARRRREPRSAPPLPASVPCLAAGTTRMRYKLMDRHRAAGIARRRRRQERRRRGVLGARAGASVAGASPGCTERWGERPWTQRGAIGCCRLRVCSSVWTRRPRPSCQGSGSPRPKSAPNLPPLPPSQPSARRRRVGSHRRSGPRAGSHPSQRTTNGTYRCQRIS